MTTHTPNFFIVGAAKSGTTSVARYLGEHPQVYMSPIKEPSYFARDIVEGLEWEAYLKLFRNVGDKIAIGEASTAYLISPMAPSDIRSAFPEARIIIVLRNPIERAFSTYQMFCRNGRLRASFSEVIRSEKTGRLADWRRMILETRRIAPGVERFLNTFPPDQIRWYFHEDLSFDALAVMEKIYSFLRVDPDFRPDVARRYNEELLPKAPFLHYAAYKSGLLGFAIRVVPAKARPILRNALFRSPRETSVSVEDHIILAEYFREDVSHLSRLVNRDLSHWLHHQD